MTYKTEFEDIEKGCGKITYDYSNQRSRGNDMEDINCGDKLDFSDDEFPCIEIELCSECEAKKSQLIKDHEAEQLRFKEFVEKINKKVLLSWEGQNEFVEYLYKLKLEMIKEEKGK